MNVLLVGNPNVGKTSIFNRLTGSRARVGNYPGITIERRMAEVTVEVDGAQVPLSLGDTPGAYSLVSRSVEEQVVFDSVVGARGLELPDVVIVVVNASQLSRNLYLVGQILELGAPVVIALNMLDEAGPDAPQPEELSAALGVECLGTHGETGEGCAALLEAAVRAARSQRTRNGLEPRYRPALREAADQVADHWPAQLGDPTGSVERKRALALWALMSLGNDELVGVPAQFRERVSEALASFPGGGSALDEEVVTARYRAIEGVLAAAQTSCVDGPTMRTAERVDRIVLHPVTGTLAFLATMFIVFQALFAWSDPAIGWVEEGITGLQRVLVEWLPVGIFRDLLVEGVVGGVGNVIVFLPQILLLFFFVGLLEDSGYMARIAYLMDRVMRSLGLHGRAFVPLLSGFACAVPAILATRTLERQRDRLLTMMVVPLMTCSARLPVYTLIIAALFPIRPDQTWPVQSLLMIGLYLFSVLTALVAAAVLGRTVIPGKSVPLILELPAYRIPRLGPTLSMMRTRAFQFLEEAGTVILAATVALWVLLSFPRTEVTIDGPTGPETAWVAPELQDSYGGRVSRSLEPVMQPLGFDWKITTGIVGAFAAREVFVSTLGLVFGMEDLDDEAAPLRDQIRDERTPEGDRKYTPLMGLSLMVFFALACQCMSTLAVVKRETAGYKWPAFLFVYMTGLAYVCSFVVYQGGRALGFE